MSPEEKKQHILKIFERIDAGDHAGTTPFFTPELKVHTAGMPVLNVEQFQQWGTAFHEGIPDGAHTLKEFINEGEKVAIRAFFEGTNSGSMQGMPPSGKKVAFEFSMFFNFMGDKVDEIWFFFDQLDFMQQLGVIPKNQ